MLQSVDNAGVELLGLRLRRPNKY